MLRTFSGFSEANMLINVATPETTSNIEPIAKYAFGVTPPALPIKIIDADKDTNNNDNDAAEERTDSIGNLESITIMPPRIEIVPAILTMVDVAFLENFVDAIIRANIPMTEEIAFVADCTLSSSIIESPAKATVKSPNVTAMTIKLLLQSFANPVAAISTENINITFPIILIALFKSSSCI